MEEYSNLKLNDTVYFYYNIIPKYMTTVNAKIEEKRIKEISSEYVSLDTGGIIDITRIDSYFISESNALAAKLNEIKKIAKTSNDSKFKRKFKSIMQLKKVIKISEEYPEIFI